MGHSCTLLGFTLHTTLLLLLGLGRIQETHLMSPRCQKFVDTNRPDYCSDICGTDDLNDHNFQFLRYQRANPTKLQAAAILPKDCFSIDAFPMETYIHVRVRSLHGSEYQCGLSRENEQASMIGIQAVDENWNPIGYFHEGQDEQNLGKGSTDICSGEDGDIVNHRLQGAANVTVTFKKCPKDTNTNCVGLYFDPKIVPYQKRAYCGLWKYTPVPGAKKVDVVNVRFILEVYFNEKTASVTAGGKPYILSWETYLYYFYPAKIPAPSSQRPLCHNSDGLTQVDSFLTTVDTSLISPKCRASSSNFTDPCSDLCIGVHSAIPRAKYDRKYADCVRIDAFPMYKPELQVHIRVRFSDTCGRLCCKNGVAMFLVAIDEDWNKIGRIPDKYDQSTILGGNAVCKGEDSDIVDVNNPGNLGLHSSTCPGSKVEFLNIYGTSTDMPKFCFIWKVDHVKNPTTVRFMMEMKFTYYDFWTVEEIYAPVFVNTSISQSSDFLMKSYSDLYVFENSSKTDTQFGGCHDSALLTESSSILQLKEHWKAAMLTTTTTTTTTPTSTTTSATTKTTTMATTTPTTTPTTTFVPVPVITQTDPVISFQRPSVTTSATTKKPKEEVQMEKAKIEEKKDTLYEECEKTKKCIAGYSPVCNTEDEIKSGKKKLKIEKGQADCVRGKNCEFLISYGQQEDNNIRIKDTEILIQMAGRSLFWIAAGFSKDDRMGDDFVVECVWYDGDMSVFTSWNYDENGDRGNRRMTEAQYKENVRLIDGYISEGNMFCSFALKKKITFDGELYDFERRPYKTLMAYGNSLGPNRSLTKHGPNNALYSPVSSVFGETFGPTPYQEEMIKWHGLIMWVTWLIVIPISNLMGRYYKETFEYKIFGAKLWLIIHVGLCSFGILLIFGAHGVLTEANNSWHSLAEKFSEKINFHLWFSLICSSLCFFNLFIGCLVKETLRGEKISCFTCTTFHKYIGHIAYAIGMASLYTSPDTLYSRLPCSIKDIMIAWAVVYHVTLFIIMQYHSLWVDWIFKMVTTRPRVAASENPLEVLEGSEPHQGAEAPGAKWRKVVLAVFCAIALGFCIRFIIFSISASHENACFRIDSVTPKAVEPVTVTAACNPPSSAFIPP